MLPSILLPLAGLIVSGVIASPLANAEADPQAFRRPKSKFRTTTLTVRPAYRYPQSGVCPDPITTTITSEEVTLIVGGIGCTETTTITSNVAGT
jgi:hypothetical protein